MKPVFYLLAGPNGAGKSTLYKALLAAKQIPYDPQPAWARQVLGIA